jgi:glycosyltransferase involved in cell wall biosynthesis
MPRVALVTNVLAHYRVPCFKRLAELLPGQATFFFLAENMQHRHYVMAGTGEGLPGVVLRGWRWSRFPHDDLHLSDLRPVIRRRCEVLILGAWDEPTYLLLWIWGVLSRKKLLFWIESTANDMARSQIEEHYKRFLLRQADGCIVPGRRSYEYCLQLGVAEESIHVAPNATNRTYFQKMVGLLMPKRAALRAESGLNGLVALFVGRLVENLKGVSTLIRACAQLERRGIPVSLLLAGDGPDRNDYQEMARTVGLNTVRFLGTVGHDELCRYYAAADVLVLPSRSEPWGFVLNEGMEFGLPLVVSEAVGAGPDLVRPGENGVVVPVGDVLALAEAMERLARDETLRKKMGVASQSIIRNFSPTAWARGVTQAIAAVTSRP